MNKFINNDIIPNVTEVVEELNLKKEEINSKKDGKQYEIVEHQHDYLILSQLSES